jgi:hypothetical protein
MWACLLDGVFPCAFSWLTARSGVNRAIAMSVLYYFVLRDPHNLLFGEYHLVSHAAAVSVVALAAFVSDLVIMVRALRCWGAVASRGARLGCLQGALVERGPALRHSFPWSAGPARCSNPLRRFAWCLWCPWCPWCPWCS